MTTRLNNATEVWHQDNDVQDLWHGNSGLMINTAALKERETYLEIICVPSASVIESNHLSSNFDSATS